MLMDQMRYFVWQSFLAILVLSLGIYYAFMWVCNYLASTNTYGTIPEIHLGANYYLTIGVCVVACYSVDLLFTALKFNVWTSPPDFLRALVQKRDLTAEEMQREIAEFERLAAETKTHYLGLDIKREEQLEKRREQLAKLVSERNTVSKVSPSKSGAS